MPDYPPHLLVDGAGCNDVNGVFALQEGLLHEQCPVYAGLSDFSITVCQGPSADDGSLQWGWIIGQAGVPAYGCPTDKKEVIPMQGWQAFEADSPAPNLRGLWDKDEEAAAFADEAFRRAASDTIGNQKIAVKEQPKAVVHKDCSIVVK